MPAASAKPKESLGSLVARRTGLLSTLLAVLVLAAGYFALLGPKYREITVGGGFDMTSLESEHRIATARAANLQQLVDTYEATDQAVLDRLDAMLPERPDNAGIFEQLEALALANGFALGTVSIEPVAAPSDPAAAEAQAGRGIEQHGISIVLGGGTYGTLKGFLDDVESNLRLLDVTAVSFVGDTGPYQISMTTYSRSR